MASRRTILIAEDDANDAFIFRHAYTQASLNHNLRFVDDGEDVVRYLERKAPFSDRRNFPPPDLLVLDLKMPRMGGFDVLNWLRFRPQWGGLPVVILSGSDLDEDRVHATHLGARAFYRKPIFSADMQDIILQICANWLGESDLTHAA